MFSVTIDDMDCGSPAHITVEAGYGVYLSCEYDRQGPEESGVFLVFGRKQCFQLAWAMLRAATRLPRRFR